MGNDLGRRFGLLQLAEPSGVILIGALDLGQPHAPDSFFRNPAQLVVQQPDPCRVARPETLPEVAGELPGSFLVCCAGGRPEGVVLCVERVEFRLRRERTWW